MQIITYSKRIDLLRNKESYICDFIQKDASAKEEKHCVWYNIENFHFTENYAVDIMQDLFQGVCGYRIQPILPYYIYYCKLFSLDTSNSRIQTFDYGNLEKGNRPPPVTAESLTISLRMSSAEMLCFTRYLGLIIGYLIPLQFGMGRLSCIKNTHLFITSSQLEYSCSTLIGMVVNEYLELYVTKQILKQELKPKHHYLLHCARISEFLALWFYFHPSGINLSIDKLK